MLNHEFDSFINNRVSDNQIKILTSKSTEEVRFRN